MRIKAAGVISKMLTKAEERKKSIQTCRHLGSDLSKTLTKVFLNRKNTEGNSLQAKTLRIKGKNIPQ